MIIYRLLQNLIYNRTHQNQICTKLLKKIEREEDAKSQGGLSDKFNSSPHKTIQLTVFAIVGLQSDILVSIVVLSIDFAWIVK